ncbi:MAG: SUMF1/EgtB/PvdO family nonheme iron enzyme [Betaproteobacteria bacterium]|nr:SUMF1/EgtB/PvdO family nonheme iron enzyme [Betaproteobacteria bacterium]
MTQAQWEQVMGGNPSAHKGADLPVENVSWYDAVSFCNKLSAKEGLRPAYRISGKEATWDESADGYHLPTAEGNARAVRGRRRRTIPEPTNLLWDAPVGMLATPEKRTHPVGQKAANAWGLHDMHGNVWEWCWDWYADYGGGSAVDPRGPSSGLRRVLRGGSWLSVARLCRSASRLGDVASRAYDYLGFRVVRSSAR